MEVFKFLETFYAVFFQKFGKQTENFNENQDFLRYYRKKTLFPLDS